MPLYLISFGMKHLLVRFISLIDCLPQHMSLHPSPNSSTKHLTTVISKCLVAYTSLICDHVMIISFNHGPYFVYSLVMPYLKKITSASNYPSSVSLPLGTSHFMKYSSHLKPTQLQSPPAALAQNKKKS
jgi:hypothetical protein